MKQVDIILLDFAKAFDTVPHQRLLKKLKHYGMINDILNWIKAWLTDWTQHVLLKGESSPSIIVTSGAPQGTVLGPLMFLLYINDISRNITSSLRLFAIADDCLLYRIIDSHDDITILQGNHNRLSEWVQIWRLRFIVSNCVVMRCTRSQSPIVHNYRLYFLICTLLHNVCNFIFRTWVLHELGVMFDFVSSPCMNII